MLAIVREQLRSSASAPSILPPQGFWVLASSDIKSTGICRQARRRDPGNSLVYFPLVAKANDLIRPSSPSHHEASALLPTLLAGRSTRCRALRRYSI